LTFAVVASGALFLASPASAFVVTFDDLSGRALVPSPYGGIDWDDNWLHYDVAQDPYNPASPPTRIFTNYDRFPEGSSAAVPFFFVADSVFDGVWLSGATSVFFELFHDGTLLHTTSSYTATGVPTFVGSGFAGLVDEVRVNGSAGRYVLDDVTYDAAAVPEPGTLLLVSAGLLGLRGIRRRDRVRPL
jgi:hypothetical protein